MVDGVDLLGTQHLNVAALVGVGLGMGKVVTVSDDRRYEGGHFRHSEITRKGVPTGIYLVGQH